MQYTTRTGGREDVSHVNYQCPCGCVAGLIYNRESGTTRAGRCCCGRLLWVGADAQSQVRAIMAADVAYEIEQDDVTLPWGDVVAACLAVPADLLAHEAEEAAGGLPALVYDPVCNMRIDPRTAKGTSKYDGRTFYFCATTCKNRFDADPAHFAAKAH